MANYRGNRRAVEEPATERDKTETLLDVDASRGSREAADRQEDLAAGKVDPFRGADLDAFRYQPLPDPPPISGYHLIWLSTTNRTQSVAEYLRRGYQLVKNEEVSSHQFEVPDTGQFAGYVMCREMILAKIPLEHYNRIMNHFHHDEPNSDEASIRENFEAEVSATSRGKSRVELEQGMDALGRGGFRRPAQW